MQNKNINASSVQCESNFEEEKMREDLHPSVDAKHTPLHRRCKHSHTQTHTHHLHHQCLHQWEKTKSSCRCKTLSWSSMSSFINVWKNVRMVGIILYCYYDITLFSFLANFDHKYEYEYKYKCCLLIISERE